MTIYSGTKKIGSLYFGTQSIAKAYRGDNFVFQKKEPIPFKFLYADIWYGYPTAGMEFVARVRWYAEGDAKHEPVTCRYSRKETSAQDYPYGSSVNIINPTDDGGHYWGWWNAGSSIHPSTLEAWNRLQDIKIVALKQDGSILDEIEFRAHQSFGTNGTTATSITIRWNPIYYGTNPAACEYKLQYMKADSFDHNPVDASNWTTIYVPKQQYSTVEYTITGLLPGTSYAIKLTALQSGNPTSVITAPTRSA